MAAAVEKAETRASGMKKRERSVPRRNNPKLICSKPATNDSQSVSAIRIDSVGSLCSTNECVRTDRLSVRCCLTGFISGYSAVKLCNGRGQEQRYDSKGTGAQVR